MKSLKEVYQDVKEVSGYIVGERAKGALQTAKNVLLARELGLEVKWEYEQEDWMTFAGDPNEEYRRNFESGKWECFQAYVQDESGDYIASLGGIVIEAGKFNEQSKSYEYKLLDEAVRALMKG